MLTSYAIIRVDLVREDVDVIFPSIATLRLRKGELIRSIKELKRLLSGGLGFIQRDLTGVRLYYGDRIVEIRFNGNKAIILTVD